jgi:hypothetical protein
MGELLYAAHARDHVTVSKAGRPRINPNAASNTVMTIRLSRDERWPSQKLPRELGCQRTRTGLGVLLNAEGAFSFSLPKSSSAASTLCARQRSVMFDSLCSPPRANAVT